MNKINPLYLLGFFVIVAIFMIYKTKQMEESSQVLSQRIAILSIEGKHIKTLKDRWKDSSAAKKRVEKIINQKLYAKYVKSKELKRGIYYVVVDSLHVRELDKLINDILNASISIKKISLDRTNEHNASAKMEFAL